MSAASTRKLQLVQHDSGRVETYIHSPATIDYPVPDSSSGGARYPHLAYSSARSEMEIKRPHIRLAMAASRVRLVQLQYEHPLPV